MNQRTLISADGFARRVFTVDDVDRMVEAGVIRPDERLEIVDGELLPMAAKGARHEVLKQHLNLLFARTLPEGVTFIQEAGWRLHDHLYLEPDFLFFPSRLSLPEVKGPDALLVIELSDSTLGYDLGRKPPLYAGQGVREYWVIDAVNRQTHVHLAPGRGGYAGRRVYGPDDELRPEWVSGIAFRLSDVPVV